MCFYENYVLLCNKIGKTPSAVAVEIGLSKPAVNRWKNGGRPTDATIRKVASYFGVDVSEMMAPLLPDERNSIGIEQTKKPTDQKVSGLTDAGYELLTPEHRQMIDSMIAALLKSQSGE